MNTETLYIIYDRDPVGLNARFSLSIFNNAVFLPAKEADTSRPGSGLHGSIVLSFSIEALSLPFTSCLPQRSRKRT